MRLFVVDAFTDSAFRGNPAGVVLLDTPAEAAWMQAVAAELRHSETAFVVTAEEPKPLRWFTPETEVDLCGHATLAAAHVLGGEQAFGTRSGVLHCRAEDGRVAMDFPADPPTPVAEDVAAALPGATVEHVLRGGTDLLAVLRDGGEVRALRPDLDAVAGLGARCLIVTAPGDRAGIDVVSRVFAPAVGIPEDPVTGSAHCTLAPYWARRLGRDALTAEQASARGGIVHLRLDGERVTLSGGAVTVVDGTLRV
ncbi:PhzF family phenazine biosynthesis protein [Prauserella muralis]|uniref:Oxidoreductase n=1 Tax=Prauserella muralis TaxID=588067 RepID=A0A2V4B6V9_9PSEU|nr:PhzF family phenazine biosynthesis protein [Prauserella muralis]PXY30980.1 oxidoreductase [Prauserella muralis]TWE14758.1 PhzF family phenazine biosynthesis protein [Prauserella muralis]